MPFLDVLHLFFEPSAAIEDEASLFGKEWRMTLEYVLHQSGLTSAYTSRLSDGSDMWVFLAWATEDDRSHFYHQTTGFGFLSDRMSKAPSVFFFGDGDYEDLDKSIGWTIDVYAAENQSAEDPKHLSEQQEKEFLGFPGQYNFAARQRRTESEKLFRGNDFSYALIGVCITTSRSSMASIPSFRPDSYEVELRKSEKTQYPRRPHIEVPLDVADLTSRHPWEYGVLSYDGSEYADTATPMSLEFQPMSMLSIAAKAPLYGSHRQPVEGEATEPHFVSVISVSYLLPNGSPRDEHLVRTVQEMVGLLDGLQGLQELRVLRTIAPSDLRFLCTWNKLDDLTIWWQTYITRKDAYLDIHAVVDYTWVSDKVGWKGLQWNNMPLTPDKQAWQKVDKILEIVEFSFSQPPTDAERKAFDGRLYDLTNTMSSCWSGDVDERPVVYAEDPVWADTEGVLPSCLLFLAWDGPEQRVAWLRNFVANSFTWTGHIAHVLGLICSQVKSGTYEMETLYTWQETRDGFAYGYGEDEEDESDRDMGF